MYSQHQDSSAYFLTIREEQSPCQNEATPPRRFKVKFRSREEFFAVTVSKLRRAISAVLDKSSSSNNCDNSSFSLEFEQVDEISVDTTFKSCKLPEGQLAELALISDWGVKPGMTISLIWNMNYNNQMINQTSSSSNNKNNAKVSFLDQELQSSEHQYNNNHLQANNLLLSHHIHRIKQQQNNRSNNNNYNNTSNTLIPPAHLASSQSGFTSMNTSLAKLSTIHDEEESNHQQLFHDANNNNNFANFPNQAPISSNKTESLLASAQELRAKLQNSQTTFFLSDNLTPAQKKLQLRWMKELEGGNIDDDDDDDDERNEAKASSEAVMTSRPPVYGIRPENNNNNNNGKITTSRSPSLLSATLSPPQQQQQQQQQYLQEQTRRSVSSSADSYERLMEYSADRNRQNQNQLSYSPESISANSPISFGYLAKKYQQPASTNNNAEDPSLQPFPEMKKLATTERDEVKSDDDDIENEHESNPNIQSPRAKQLQEAIRDADRRENIRLREQISLISAELDVWKDRANCAYDSLDRKLASLSQNFNNNSNNPKSSSSSNSSYATLENRKILADALIDAETLRKKLNRQHRDLQSTKLALEDERRIRRSMQRDLEFLRGHIRVVVRIRGGGGNGDDDKKLSSSNSSIAIHGDNTMITLNRGLLKPRGEFEFYKVLPTRATQSDFFDLEIAPMVDVSFTSNRSLCLIFYGATSSGKTYSSFGASANLALIKARCDTKRRNFFFSNENSKNSGTGDDDDDDEVGKLLRIGKNGTNDDAEEDRDLGVTFRAAKLLLQLGQSSTSGQQQKTSSSSLQLGLSIIELYCDEIRDLLAPNVNNNTNSSKKSDSTSSSSPTISIFRTEQEVFQLISNAARQRWTESTASNSQSSRSHCLVTFSVFGKQNNVNVNELSKNSSSSSSLLFKIVIADLAGSERLHRSQSTGQRLIEAQHINKSLSALGDVVHALTSSQNANSSKPFIPYRNSPLTMLLQDSMNGDSMTLFIACVVNDEEQVEETYSTLNFASRVRCIKNLQFCKKINNNNNNNNNVVSNENNNNNNIITQGFISLSNVVRPKSPSASSRPSTPTNNSKSGSRSASVTNNNNNGTVVRRGSFSNGTATTSSQNTNSNTDDVAIENNNTTKRTALTLKNENRVNNNNNNDTVGFNLPQQKSSVETVNNKSKILQPSGDVDDYFLIDEAKLSATFASVQQSGHLSATETARLRQLLFRK